MTKFADVVAAVNQAGVEKLQSLTLQHQVYCLLIEFVNVLQEDCVYRLPIATVPIITISVLCIQIVYFTEKKQNDNTAKEY